MELFTKDLLAQLQGDMSDLRKRNAWLVSQQPENLAQAQLVKDNSMKKKILKKRNNILNFLDIDKLEDDKSHNGGNNDYQQQAREQSPLVHSQINEAFMKGIQRHVPLKWDPLTKKWFGPDVICVSNAFK